MSRYIVFSGEAYYPQGGAFDLDETFDDVNLARNYSSKVVKTKDYDWSHVYDTKNSELVVRYGNGYGQP